MPSTTLQFTPAVRDLSLYAGDGAALRLTITREDGTPVPITGLVDAQIRKARTDTTVLASFVVDLADADAGVIVVRLSGAQTAALAASGNFSGVWDVQWTPDGSEPVTLLQGNVKCALDVTRVAAP